MRAETRGKTGKKARAKGPDAGPVRSSLFVNGVDTLIAEKLRRMERLAIIGTLTAATAHEIKNALVAGKTFFDSLLEKNQDAELAALVRREIGRIDALAVRMLNFAAQDRAGFKVLHVHEVLEHSLRLVQPQFDDKSITLTTHFNASPDLIQGDDHQLQQAFMNLFFNALEAMGPEGRLSVSTEIARANGETGLLINIQDTGPGIPPEVRQRLFEPFFTTKPEGTGLGLVVTKSIVQEHKAELRVTSEPGKGTTFSILLPAA